MENILILGASGFIGSHLVDRLKNSHCHLSCFSRSIPSILAKQPSVHWIQGDFYAQASENQTLYDALERATTIVHCLCDIIPATSQTRSKSNLDQDLISTRKFIEEIPKKSGEKLIFLS